MMEKLSSNVMAGSWTRTDMAYDLLEKGHNDEEIVKLTGLAMLTIKKYRVEYNKKLETTRKRGKNGAYEVCVPLFKAGKDNTDIQNETGYALNSIRTYRVRYNRETTQNETANTGTTDIKTSEPKKKVVIKEKKVLELMKNGLNNKDIAKIIGCKETSLKKIRTIYNKTKKENIAETAEMAKSEARTRVEMIGELAERGTTREELCKMFNLERSTIRKYISKYKELKKEEQPKAESIINDSIELNELKNNVFMQEANEIDELFVQSEPAEPEVVIDIMEQKEEEVAQTQPIDEILSQKTDVEILRVDDNNKDKVSRKEAMYKLIRAGKTNYQIANEMGIGSASVATYRSKYNKEFGVKTSGKGNFTKVTDTTRIEHCSTKEPLIPIKGGNNIVNKATTSQVEDKTKKYKNSIIKYVFGEIEYEVDSYESNDEKWLDFNQILNMVLKETNFKMNKTFNISERYLKDEVINGSMKNLIDNNILLEFANKINDYRLIEAILGSYRFSKDIFYRTNKIVDALDLLQQLPSELEEYKDKEVFYNQLQLDMLHDWCNMDSDEQALLDEAKRMKEFTDERRNIKNRISICTEIRSNLRWFKISNVAIQGLQKSVNKNLTNLYLKKYNRRTEGADGWKQEVAEKYLIKKD